VKIVFKKHHFVLPIYIEGVVLFMIQLDSFIRHFGLQCNNFSGIYDSAILVIRYNKQLPLAL
ncbi:MAG TPA: hypothetical protein PL063_08385, partial [Candidatus Cloacimonadota bacterium]|nr:hypothetical protein [Candidatus Cloacimonadota bacterium]